MQEKFVFDGMIFQSTRNYAVDLEEKMPELKRVQEAAARWNVSTKTAWNWIAEGRVAVVRLGRSVRIPSDEIERLITEGYSPARQRYARTEPLQVA